MMKRLMLPATTLVLAFILIYYTAPTGRNNTINPVIGDISYVKELGHLPLPGTNEDFRIKTHLAYVERILRKRENSYLQSHLKQNREKMLNHLREYWIAGIFPRNFDQKDKRSPCFIDKDGRICAVGYLIEKTAGRGIANQINQDFKYHEIMDMNSDLISNWIASSGFTREELAMIQPTYGWFPPPGEDNTRTANHISASYGISSSVLSGINLSMNTINAITLMNGDKSKAAQLGLLSGAAQLGLGLATFPKKKVDIGGNFTINESKRTLSMINIGLGTSSIILSAWNLIRHEKPKDPLLSWDIYSFPLSKEQTGLALSIKRRF